MTDDRTLPVVNYWDNVKTGESEGFVGYPPDERLHEFIPQDAASQGVYHVCIEMGKTPVEAMTHVLKLWAGEAIDDDSD